MRRAKHTVTLLLVLLLVGSSLAAWPRTSSAPGPQPATVDLPGGERGTIDHYRALRDSVVTACIMLIVRDNPIVRAIAYLLHHARPPLPLDVLLEKTWAVSGIRLVSLLYRTVDLEGRGGLDPTTRLAQ